ncbi:MAG: conserved membrane protein of unknown function [Promethearchaeota archaeon]|nr:MAG: conserved membrane protein of unknown function [Candidatus Lokiarchaeota archaeon]
MSKKSIYVCNECGYVFPEELTELIENKKQVYCERCGTPFTLKGVNFKPLKFEDIKKPSELQKSKKRESSSTDGMISSFEKFIKRFINFLNYIAFIPLLVVAIIEFVGFFIGIANLRLFANRLFIALALTAITYYDLGYIKPKIQNDEYDEVFLDVFCFGILGSIIYGTGSILIVQGVLVIVYILVKSANKEVKLYDIGLKAKNSINEFSASAGFIIILIVLSFLIQGDLLAIDWSFKTFFLENNISFMEEQISLFGFLIVLGIIMIFLLIDYNRKDSVEKAVTFSPLDFIKTFILGIITTSFYSAGIFILLKAILILILAIGKPSELEEKKEIQELHYKEEKRVPYEPISHTEHVKKGISQKDFHPYKASDFKKQETFKKKEQVKKEIQKLEKEESPQQIEKTPEKKKLSKKEKKEELEERIHESLLPVKDKKDKKLVREYFSKIFNILSKDLRKQIKNLKIPKKDKRDLLEELAFLTKTEQSRYIEAIVNLYKEELPAKLINRIRNIPNIKPEHYESIVNQLRYMDSEEQIEFVQFLENHTPNYK